MYFSCSDIIRVIFKILENMKTFVIGMRQKPPHHLQVSNKFTIDY